LAIRRSDDNFVTFDTADGEEVQVEIERTAGDFVPIRSDRSLGRFEFLSRPVFEAVGTLIRDAREVGPDTVNIRFGIKITASGSAIVSRNVNEGNFDISLTWNRQSPESELKQ
jgi:hypothetical protein